MSTRRCECGYEASDDLDLQDHWQEAFVPPDGIAPDGSVHDEGAVPGGLAAGLLTLICLYVWVFRGNHAGKPKHM
jgi:hypothetical protein